MNARRLVRASLVPLVRLHLTRPARLAPLVVASVLLLFGRGEASVDVLPLLLPFVVLMASLLMPPRMTLLERSLPLSTQALLAVRVAVHATLLLSPVLVWLGTRALGYAGGPVPWWTAWSLVLQIVAVLALPYLLARGARPGETSVPQLSGAFAMGSAATVGVAMGVFYLPPWAQVAAPACLAVLLWGLSVAPRRSVVSPDAFEGEGVSARATQITDASAATPREDSPREHSLLRLTIRTAFPLWQRIAWGLLLCVTFETAYYGQGLVRVMLWPVMMASTLLIGTRVATVLPVPGWYRIGLIVLLGPVSCLATYAAGLGTRHIVDGRYRTSSGEAPWTHAPPTDEPRRMFSNPTRVDVAYWRRAESGQVPVIVAPWGERVSPFATTILGWRLYNPYSARADNSAAFVSWQWQRLTTAVYGRALPRDTSETAVWPPSRLNDWRVRVLFVSMIVAAMLLLIWGAWTARCATSGLAAYGRMTLGFSPAILQLAMQLTNDDLSDPTRAFLLNRILWFVDGVPAMPFVSGALVVGVSLVMLMVPIGCLWRDADQPALEYRTNAWKG